MMAAEPAGSGRTDIGRLALPGFCASFVSIGLARFAYTPLLPAIISNRWFSADAAAYLAAANLAGYLIGVLGADLATRHVPPPFLLRAAMVVASLSLIACAVPAGAGWFFMWRLVSGIGGGVAMVMAAPAIFPHVPPSRRGVVGGAIFMGVGFGIALSGTLVPLLLTQSLVCAWLGLGLVAGLFTWIGWNGWLPAPGGPDPHRRRQVRLPLVPLRGLYLIYGLNAFALVPHMVFLVDFVARGLGRGLASATQYWMLYGIGAVVGPLIAGRAADRWGARAALVYALTVQLVAIALPAITVSPLALIASCVVVGACTIGIVPLVLGRTREVLLHHPSAHFSAWRTATASFALLQATGAYGMSFLFDWSGGAYRLLFAVGAAAIAAALSLALMTQRETSDQQG
jgi:predicted MFS family arabinose efflux permease